MDGFAPSYKHVMPGCSQASALIRPLVPGGLALFNSIALTPPGLFCDYRIGQHRVGASGLRGLARRPGQCDGRRRAP